MAQHGWIRDESHFSREIISEYSYPEFRASPELPGTGKGRAAKPGIKKFGGAISAPPEKGSFCRLQLERDPRTELYLPHQAVGLQASDQPATAAINATVGIAIDGMIEHIEEFQL